MWDLSYVWSIFSLLVCTSGRISRAILFWRSCTHNRLTLQNEPMCSWQVWQEYSPESRYSLKPNWQRWWCCYTLFCPSAILITPHCQSYRSGIGGKLLALPRWSICLAAAHHHSSHITTGEAAEPSQQWGKQGEPARANTVHQLWRAKLSGIYQLTCKVHSPQRAKLCLCTIVSFAHWMC